MAKKKLSLKAMAVGKKLGLKLPKTSKSPKGKKIGKLKKMPKM